MKPSKNQRRHQRSRAMGAHAARLPRLLALGCAGLLGGPLMAEAAEAEAAASRQGLRHSHRLSMGGTYRLKDPDPRYIGVSNGGSADAINVDDGTRNFNKGWVNWGVMGRSTFDYADGPLEAELRFNYFYDMLLNNGRTDLHPLPDEAISRVGRGGYLTASWVGWNEQRSQLPWRLRFGNQVLRWGESPSPENQINFINPLILSRTHLPGAAVADVYGAVPMLWGQIGADDGWRAEAFWQTRFRPSEANPRGSFFNGNDYYSPGGDMLFLDSGVPDADVSVISPATPFGSRIRRENIDPGHSGQYGAAFRTPKLGGDWKAEFGLYLGRFTQRELNLSSRVGLLSDLMGLTAPDFASGSRYLVNYPRDNKLIGASAKFWPSFATQVRVDVSQRRNVALQLDDKMLLVAGMAPGAVAATCAPNPASARCQGTLAQFNANPLVRQLGGITPANLDRWFGRVIDGGVRKNLSQLTLGASQGLPNVFGSRLWVVNAEWNAQYIHDYDPDVMPIDSPAPTNGTVANGIASRIAAAYKIGSRIDFTNVGLADRFSLFGQFQHEYRGNSPFPRSMYMRGRKWLVLGFEAGFGKSWVWQAYVQKQLNRFDIGDTEGDKPYLSTALTYSF